MKFHYAGDVSTSHLKESRIAIIGFGNQARAQAKNLRDSGLDVSVGLRTGSPSMGAAERGGFRVMDVEEAARRSNVICLIFPDEEQGAAYRDSIAPALTKGDTLLFAHGFAIHFEQIAPPSFVDVILVAPKGPGHQVRREYLKGHGVVMLTAVHRDFTGTARAKAFEYASAIGGGKAGIFESTFREECETDLFGEQAVICGGLSHLIIAGFETLVEEGYRPEMAYLECLHEVKLVADLIQRRGIAGMREAISGTARFGDLTRGPRVIGPQVKGEMKKILSEIRSGDFAREWSGERIAGKPLFAKDSAETRLHPIETTGRELREKILPAEKTEAAGPEENQRRMRTP